MTLGKRIERLRKLTGLSARELAALAELKAASHIRFIETSKSDQIGAGTLSKVADVFGTTMDWLYRGAGAAPTDESVLAAVARAQRARANASRRTGTDG